jgi:1,4-alpha-glucan branching enzyme
MPAPDPASASPAVAADENRAPRDFSRLSADDLYLFNEGGHFRLYEKFGAHPGEVARTPGTYFAVWAPNAARVSVIGDFNQWNPDANPLRTREESGIWEGFLPGVSKGALYKYHLVSTQAGYAVAKADPVGFRFEAPPRTASVVWDLAYAWRDEEWMRTRAERNALSAPLSIYEVHLGSWMRVPE